MSSDDAANRRHPAELDRAAELRLLRERLCGTVLRCAPMKSLFLRQDGEYVRESGAGASQRGRWAIEDFLDSPALVLRQAGAVSTILPVAIGGPGVVLLGGAAWMRADAV